MVSVAFKHVGLKQRVVFNATQSDTVIHEYVRVVLDMLANFFMILALEPRSQLLQHVTKLKLTGAIRVLMTDWNIRRMPGRYRERNANKVSCHVVKAVCFSINGCELSVRNFVDPFV